MKQSLRHQKIIELVKLKGYASTEELVIELEVSPQTIRRDLNILAEQDFNSSSSWWRGTFFYRRKF